jgi:DNA-binding CsgD family transcriptional regulator/tetratricopeptide (TPR) repeat protein
VELLERDAEIAAFDAALDEAAAGSGSVLLVHGEAGIGKTGVVQAIARRSSQRARVLIGACDDLLTPRTLGPFRDMTSGDDAPLRRALASESPRDAVLGAVIEEFSDPLRPTVVIVEDIHWADEATRDVLAFLGRRVHRLPAILLVTYRDDLASDHPVRATLGALTGPHCRRLPLRALSPAALTSLCAGRNDLTLDRLMELTGGNPFLVTQLLGSPDAAVPLPVRDAVAARVRGLNGPEREVVELLAVAPGGLELSLLLALVPSALHAVGLGEHLGLLEVDGTRVRFRHELLRRATEATSPAGHLVTAHARILAALERDDADPSRAVHHALGAGDGAAIARHAPAAARRAAAVASHRDAIVLFEQAIRHSDDRSDPDRARLLRWYAFELYLANRHLDAVHAANRAVTALAGVDAPEDLGKALTVLSHVSCWAAQPEVALEAAERAVEVLRSLAPTEALGLAYGNLSFVTAMRGRFGESERTARQGVEVVEELDLARVRPYVTAQLGAARFLGGDPDGETFLTDAVRQAQRIGAHEYVPLAYTWLCMGALRHARPEAVEGWARLGIAYSERHQLRVGQTTLRMLLHETQLRRGAWVPAEQGLATIVRDADATGWGHSVACTLLGRLHARQGVDGALDLLSRGWRLAIQSDEPERIARAGIGWFEWAVLHDDDRARQRGEEALEAVRGMQNPWLRGELLRWRVALEGPTDEPLDAAEPWASGIRGAFDEAAAAFASLGWPFERAQELAASDRPEDMFEALRILETSGATATAARLRRTFRARGMTHLPRGPVRRTRDNPQGLTARQLEVLGLLSASLTNAQIADRLVLSVRTVDHHVAAVLDKLGVASRQAAVAEAAKLGITAVS